MALEHKPQGLSQSDSKLQSYHSGLAGPTITFGSVWRDLKAEVEQLGLVLTEQKEDAGSTRLLCQHF